MRLFQIGWFVAWFVIYGSVTSSTIGDRSPRSTIVSASLCPSGKCVSVCCQSGEYLSQASCVENLERPASPLIFPPIYNYQLQLSNDTASNYTHIYGVPCPAGSYALQPDLDVQDEFYLLENGSVYQPYYLSGTLLSLEDYCFASMIEGNESLTVVAVCFPDYTASEVMIPQIYPIAMVLSTPFLILTFLIYTIIPELNNIHGLTLRAYVCILFIAYIALAIVQLGDQDVLRIDLLCTGLAYTIYFSFLASFFWLNVMCFDIWWTFGGYRSLQGSVKQRERKKFFLYSIYAWGAAILLTALCITMDNVAAMSKDIVVPGFGVSSCWFADSKAKGLYFYVPMGITISCNIILFVSTALKIAQHKRDTAHQLKGMDSRRHDDNKQWFNLYLKLFIVMGINWSMEIISWLYDTPAYLWYITDMGNTLQGVIIFVIFVWKEKIKRLLFKRFGCQGPKFLSRDSTRSAYPSSTSRTCTTSVPLHEKNHDKMSSLPDPLPHGKTHSEDSDGV